MYNQKWQNKCNYMLKGHFVVLDIQTQNFNIYNINEVIKQTQSTYFLDRKSVV